MNKAEYYLKQNMLNEAMDEYRKILDIEPNNFIIHNKLAELYLQQEKLDQAIVHLQEVERIDKYNYEVERIDVKRNLANAYYLQNNIEGAFKAYIEIIDIYPDDIEALYHISFIVLGQEEFEIARRYFARLLKLKKNDFEIHFGAGISNYQTQNIDEAVNQFRAAVKLKPGSEIANLAIAFALHKNENYKESISYSKKLAETTTNIDVQFISKRLLAFCYILEGKVNVGKKIFEELLELSKSSNMQDNILLILYDLGFVCLLLEQKILAHDYWDELNNIEKGFNNIDGLLNLLIKEIDKTSDHEEGFDMSAADYIGDWTSNAFPTNFLWNICSLKSDDIIDIKNIVVKGRISLPKEVDDKGPASNIDTTDDAFDRIEKFCRIDTENFRIISNRIISKLGYKVDDILQTYRESDGVDFLAKTETDKTKILIWVRRWKDTKVGEITLRNFAQAVNDIKAESGLFITTAELTDAAHSSLKKLRKVTVIYPEEINNLLKGII
ncbi:MAG: tetratricopeptide repeat protein [Spirochaetota bacterium]|nr:tetratricopeptide repeat protein [Spirochaetota bacterium]